MTDELTWLRDLEQEVQCFHHEAIFGGPVQLRMLTIKKRINARIIELLEARVRPCNEIGGGSSGISTADDFAMYCSKPDRHEGPHSFEENL